MTIIKQVFHKDNLRVEQFFVFNLYVTKVINFIYLYCPHEKVEKSSSKNLNYLKRLYQINKGILKASKNNHNLWKAVKGTRTSAYQWLNHLSANPTNWPNTQTICRQIADEMFECA